jgi:hypothetical protein
MFEERRRLDGDDTFVLFLSVANVLRCELTVSFCRAY